MVIWLGLDITKIKPPKTGSNRIPNVKSKKCIFEVPSNSEMYFAKSCQYVLTCYLRLVNLSTESRGPECVNFLSTCMYKDEISSKCDTAQRAPVTFTFIVFKSNRNLY